MNPLLLSALVLHIFAGVLSLVAISGLMLLLKEQELNFKWIKIFSIIGLLGFLVSFVSGGFYYTTYYGSSVKPLIMKGSYSWAHKIVMESKEHMFLLLPFLAFVVFAFLNFCQEEVKLNEKLKYKLIILSFVIVSIGIIIALSGVAISGSVTR